MRLFARCAVGLAAVATLSLAACNGNCRPRCSPAAPAAKPCSPCAKPGAPSSAPAAPMPMPTPDSKPAAIQVAPAIEAK